MEKTVQKYKCPLCRSLLTKNKYYDIIGVWEERQKLEKSLKEEIRIQKLEKKRALQEKKDLKKKMDKEIKTREKSAFEKGQKKEKNRADKLSKLIQGKTAKMQEMSKKIKELEEQLKKGTTPQIEGLNLEEELIRQLKKEFPKDKIEHPGKAGDILHHIVLQRKQIGTILYECKKTARFSNTFIDQTKKAVAKRKATYGVLVTTAFRKNTAGFWVEKDILIVHPYGAVYVAKVLRGSLIEMYSLKISGDEKKRRSKELMNYIKSDNFKNNVSDSIYRTKTLYEMLKKEVTTHKNVWISRYKHYEAILANVHRLNIVTTNILRGLSTKQAIKQVKLEVLPPPEEWS
jgi:hypothetical protein